MRIKIINPNTCLEMTKSIELCAKKYANLDTEIIAVSPDRGPITIEDHYDEALATVGVMEEIIKGQLEKYDGYITACFGDPGLYQGREISEAPVVGIAEASMFMACMLGNKFSIISTLKRFKAPMEELIKRYGIENRCASIRCTDIPVLEFEQNKAKCEELLLKLGKEAVSLDGAEVLCLGCAGMVGFDNILEKELGVPVIDPVAAAVKFLEGIIKYGKKTSKVMTFRPVEKKEIIGYPDTLKVNV